MHVVGDHEKMLNINLRSNQGLPSEELVLGSPVLWQEATFDAAVRAGVGLPRPRLLWGGGARRRSPWTLSINTQNLSVSEPSCSTFSPYQEAANGGLKKKATRMPLSRGMVG